MLNYSSFFSSLGRQDHLNSIKTKNQHKLQVRPPTTSFKSVYKTTIIQRPSRQIQNRGEKKLKSYFRGAFCEAVRPKWSDK